MRMPTSPLSEVIRHLGSASLRDGTDLTDEQLLECFVSRRERAALEALVLRHAPMVWGVCRRVLRNEHDAEDAFQATFLVLVRRAATIRTGAGNWLYGVAHQTALKARATRARRAMRERQVAELPEPATPRDTRDDLQSVLDQELGRLPEKYRAVIVLCDLEARTGREVARELGCPEGTVASRLSRARAMLAKRLTRHGPGTSAGAVVALLPQQAASICVPDAVMSSTITAMTLVAAGHATAGGAIADPVVVLTAGVMRSMTLTKFKTAAAVVLVGFLCVGAVGRAYPPVSEPNPPPASAPQAEPVKPAETSRVDGQAGKPPEPADRELADALKNPQLFFFGEQATSKTDPNAAHSFELVITSARNVKGDRESVTVRPGTIAIFRADASMDEFTKQGGWYWRCGKVEGKSQFKQPGALILVVRQLDGAVQWYSLHYDIRC
jgi:RNA polymerase sigma factor (sigma-70 family)